MSKTISYHRRENASPCFLSRLMACPPLVKMEIQLFPGLKSKATGATRETSGAIPAADFLTRNRLRAYGKDIRFRQTVRIECGAVDPG